MIGIGRGIRHIIPPAEMEVHGYTGSDLICHFLSGVVGFCQRSKFRPNEMFNILEIFFALPVAFKINIVFAFQDIGIIEEMRFPVNVSPIIGHGVHGQIL